MAKQISNSDDVIDSRDVIARIDELQAERDYALDEENGAEFSEEDAEELRALLALAEEGERGAADWQYGEALIRDSYFTEYAQELAEDIGAINRDLGWPYSCIDWEQAARELQMDYTSIDFDGVTYWVR